MNKYAVLTTNMQIALANKHLARQQSVKKFLPSLLNFLKDMREKNIPIIHLQLVYTDDDPRSKEPFGTLPPLKKGTEGVKLLSEIVESHDIIIEKSRDSGFFKTNLDDVLKKLNIDNVIIVGMQAYSCVQFTAVDAFFRGYHVIVNQDAIGSTRDQDTERAIITMKKHCANVKTSAEIRQQLKEVETYI